MLIIAVILLIVAICCFFAARSQAARLSAINAADTFTAQMLQDVYKQVVPSLGAEALAKQCAVSGIIEADAPLTGPLSNAACVAYTYSVTREYEEDVTTTDEYGKQTTETKQERETVSNDDRRVKFFVRDATGRVQIDPADAELDLIDSGTRFDPTPASRGRTRTLGHRHEEQSLAVGTQIYVIGCAVDGGDQPMLAHNPRDTSQKFIISRKGGRELANDTASAARNWYYATAGSGALGVLLLLIGLLG